MNSEISSASVDVVRADDHPLAVTTVDHWMRHQDQLNSGDVVLPEAGTGELARPQPGPGRLPQPSARWLPARPGQRAA